jgi:hypothetical protein
MILNIFLNKNNEIIQEEQKNFKKDKLPKILSKNISFQISKEQLSLLTLFTSAPKSNNTTTKII